MSHASTPPRPQRMRPGCPINSACLVGDRNVLLKKFMAEREGFVWALTPKPNRIRKIQRNTAPKADFVALTTYRIILAYTALYQVWKTKSVTKLSQGPSRRAAERKETRQPMPALPHLGPPICSLQSDRQWSSVGGRASMPQEAKSLRAKFSALFMSPILFILKNVV